MLGSVSKKNNKNISWKKYQKNKGEKKRLNLAFYAIGFIIILILLGKTFSFIHGLSQPANPDKSLDIPKKYSWSGDSILNLVVKSDGTYVLSIDPANQNVTILKIPDDTYMDLPEGFGSWPMRSVYDLGQAENPQVGVRLMEETISRTLAIPIDGYIIGSDKWNSQTLSEVIDGIRQNPFSGFWLVRGAKTNLSTIEITKLIWGLKDVRSTQIDNIDLGQSNVTKSKLLPDGSRVLTFDPLQLDPFIKSKFADTNITQEGFTIGIFNSTKHPGLAERAAQTVSNLGGRVTFTLSSNDDLAKTIVIGKDSYTKQRLEEIFSSACLNKTPSLLVTLGLQKLDNSCSISDPSLDLSRADINIILGEDYFINFNHSASQ